MASIFQTSLATEISQNHTPKISVNTPQIELRGDNILLLDNLSPQTPNLPIKGIPRSKIEPLMVKLSVCESGNNPNKTNWYDNGSPSYGLFQFKEKTWIEQIRKYNMFPNTEDKELINLIYDRNTQETLTMLMLIEENGWLHWKSCAKKVGLDKI